MPFDPTSIDSTPYGAPLVPALPIRLRRTEILTVVYRTDRAAADALIPSPLELAGDLCVVHVYRMHDAEWFGVYCESAFQLPVVLPDGSPAVYSPFLVLESDGAVAAGRELYGQPKKSRAGLARPRRRSAGRSRRPQRHRDRDRHDRLEAAPGRRAASSSGSCPAPPVNVNLRVLPEDGSEMRRELVSRTFADVEQHEAWVGPATLELRPNAQVPGAPAGRARGRARPAPRARPLAAARPVVHRYRGSPRA